MKKLCALLLLTLFIFACREQQNKQEDMIPVEADGGIGDGAPSLDSLLEAEKAQDTISHKNDSL